MTEQANLLHEYTVAEQKENSELNYSQAQLIVLNKHPELNEKISEDYEENDEQFDAETLKKIEYLEADIDKVAKAIMKKDKITNYSEALAKAQTKFPTLAKKYFELVGDENAANNIETNYSEEHEVLKRYLAAPGMSFLESDIQADEILTQYKGK